MDLRKETISIWEDHKHGQLLLISEDFKPPPFFCLSWVRKVDEEVSFPSSLLNDDDNNNDDNLTNK